MPLTTRTNGSGGSNIIQASWFNDFKDLLTGVMVDQPVTVKNILDVRAIGSAPSTAPTLVLATGTNLGIGVYTYAVTFINGPGETLIGPTVPITTTSGNQAVNLSAIPIGPVGTLSRRIYRSAVGGGAGALKICATISDNTTTTFSDTLADGSLGVGNPQSPSFGGSILLRDAGAALMAQFFSDGTILSNMAGISVAGSTSGTAVLYQLIKGSVKLVFVSLNNYASTAKTIALPAPFTNKCFMVVGGVGTTGDGGIQVLSNGAAGTVLLITTLAAAGGSTTGQTTVFQNSIGLFNSAWDTFGISLMTTARTATIVIIGQ